MKILITGIGCIGKSTLREKITSAFPDRVISVDMDYEKKIPRIKNKIVVVESVHGLEENPQIFDKILYLFPPRKHFFLWFKRAWTWFATGIVDLSAPKGIRKRFALTNILTILRILKRNIFNSRKWVQADLGHIQKKFFFQTVLAGSLEDGFRKIECWIKNSALLQERK